MGDVTATELKGFVVVHRTMLDSWLWHVAHSHFKLALTCLLLANWRDQQWFDGRERRTIRRGEFVTSQDNLAAAARLTVKQVRRGLDVLRRGEFIEIESGRASSYTLIRVVNYSAYQDVPDEVGEPRASEGRVKGEPRATTEQGNKGTREQQCGNPQDYPQAPLFPGSDPTPEPPANGTSTSSVTKRVMDYVNKKRNGADSSTLGWQPYLKLVKRALGAGHTEKELKLVVWWAAEHEWPLSDPDHAKRVHPSTLFPIAKSSGYRALPQYLDLAREKFRDVNRREFNPHPTAEQRG